MGTAAAIAALAELINTITNALGAASTISGLITQAQSEGRTTFTDAEWATIDAQVTSARATLAAANAKP